MNILFFLKPKSEVVDDQKKFIGIITRKSIIEYCYEKIKKLDEPY